MISSLIKGFLGEVNMDLDFSCRKCNTALHIESAGPGEFITWPMCGQDQLILAENRIQKLGLGVNSSGFLKFMAGLGIIASIVGGLSLIVTGFESSYGGTTVDDLGALIVGITILIGGPIWAAQNFLLCSMV
jgi:hypothetical protein